MKQYFETQQTMLSDVSDRSTPAGVWTPAHTPTLSEMLQDVMDDPALAARDLPTEATYDGGSGDDVYTGTDQADTINGNGGNDTLAGAGGADTIDGGDGSDKLYSANVSPAWSHSYYYIAPVAPVLDTGAEVDTLRGGAGYDLIFAGYGDNVDGGANGAGLLISFQGATAGVTADFNQLANNGTMTIGGGVITNISSVFWVDGSNFDDVLTGAGYIGGNDSPDMRGFGGNDTLIAGYNTADLFGGDGDDILDGRRSLGGGYYYGDAGNDTIYMPSSSGCVGYGGDGNDTFYGGGYYVYGGAGNDTFIPGSAYQSTNAFGEDGDDTITGTTASDVLSGGTGADVIHGGDGSDTIYAANAAPDQLDNAADYDRLYGDAGNDTLYGGYGDLIDGGTGTNTLSLALGGASAGQIVDGNAIIAGGVTIGGGTISNIQVIARIDGTGFDDTIVMPTQATAAEVHGGAGNDSLSVGASAVTLYGDAGDDTLTGGSMNDTFYGGTGADHISGAGGDDTIYVLSGDAAAGETIDGGAGIDTINTNGAGGYVTADLSGITFSNVEKIVSYNLILGAGQFTGLTSISFGTLAIANAGTVSFAGITLTETNGSVAVVTLSAAGNTVDLGAAVVSPYQTLQIQGGAGNDVITTPGNDDRIYGNGGNDVINSGAGADYVSGGAGTDIIHAGDGDDTIVVSTTDIAAGEVYDGGAGNDTLSLTVDYPLTSGSIDLSPTTLTSIETLNLISNVAVSLTGAQLQGLSAITGSFTQNLTLTTGGAISYSGSGYYLYLNLAAVNTVFDLSGLTSAYAVTVTGGSGNDTITGSQFVDTINGGAGDDTLIGGAGNDSLNGGVGNGNDRLDGGIGADTLTGGAGDDTYILDNVGDRAVELANGGNDTIESSVTVTSVNAANVETIRLTGTANINATGTADVANILIGNSGDNVLDGGAGTGVGGDRLEGGLGDDTYVIRSSTDVIVEGTNAGNDAVYVSIIAASYTLAADAQVETLATLSPTSTAAINLTGNAYSHDIQGNAGNNVLTGGTGADTILGNGGVDTLLGGAGNDRLIVGSSGTGTIVDGGADTDTLVVTGSVSLGGLSNIEAIELQNGANLTLTGDQFNTGLALGTVLSGTGTITVNMTPDQFLLGSTLAVAPGSSISVVFNGSSGNDYVKGITQATNTMIGGDGNDFLRGGQLADVIDGGAGGDKITGFGGADTLTGGGGANQFRYLTQSDSGLGANADHITDFTIGSDRLNFQLFDGDTNTPDLQNPGFSFLGNQAFHATGAAEIRYEDAGSDLVVQVDVNGDGVADMAIYLNGLHGATLTGAEFML